MVGLKRWENVGSVYTKQYVFYMLSAAYMFLYRFGFSSHCHTCNPFVIKYTDLQHVLVVQHTTLTVHT